MTETNRGKQLCFPHLYEIAGSAVSIKLLSVMQLLSATGFCIIFLSIVSRVLKERLYLRHVEVFRFVNKCRRDSGLG